MCGAQFQSTAPPAVLRPTYSRSAQSAVSYQPSCTAAHFRPSRPPGCSSALRPASSRKMIDALLLSVGGGLFVRQLKHTLYPPDVCGAAPMIVDPTPVLRFPASAANVAGWALGGLVAQALVLIVRHLAAHLRGGLTFRVCRVGQASGACVAALYPLFVLPPFRLRTRDHYLCVCTDLLKIFCVFVKQHAGLSLPV